MWNPRPLSELIKLIIDKGAQRRIAIVIGAGASHPYPTAMALKEKLVQALIRTAHPDATSQEAQALLDALHQRLTDPYTTLENLFLLCEYVLDEFESSAFFSTEAIIRSSLSGLRSSPGALAAATLRHRGFAGPLITSNFDTLLFDTLDQIDPAHESWSRILKTDAQFEHAAAQQVGDQDIVAFHGTLLADTGFTTPNTLIARGLIRPFRPGISNWFQSLLAQIADETDPRGPMEIVFFGYSGSDYYDINIEISRALDRFPMIAQRMHWIAYSGKQTDLSEFATSYPFKFYGPDPGMATADFADAVLKCPVFLTDSSWQVRNTPKPASVVIELQAGTPDKVRLLQARAANVLHLLQSGFLGAWAISEHYSLLSYGFDQDTVKRLSKPIHAHTLQPASMDYFGVDLSLFVDGQEAYYAHRGETGKLPQVDIEQMVLLAPEEGTKALFKPHADIATFFTALKDDVRSALRSRLSVDPDASSTPSPNESSINAAMLLIFLSIANDYLGLMAMRFAELVRQAIANDYDPKVLAASQYAMDLFDEAARTANLSRDFADKTTSRPEHALRDMVPYLIWSLIARENRTRCMLDASGRAQRLLAFSLIVAEREDLIATAIRHGQRGAGGLEDIATYFLPQATLRATEAIKAVYHSETAKNPVPAAHLIDASELAEAARLLERARAMRDMYKKRSSLRNHLLITVYDCEIIIALAQRDARAVLDVVHQLVHDYAEHMRSAEIRTFIRNIAARLEHAWSLFGDPQDVAAINTAHARVRALVPD